MTTRRKSSIVSVAAPLAADYCATDILTIDLNAEEPKRVCLCGRQWGKTGGDLGSRPWRDSGPRGLGYAESWAVEVLFPQLYRIWDQLWAWALAMLFSMQCRTDTG